MNAGVFASDKIYQHAERIAEWHKTGTCAPVTVEFDLTNACNHKCPKCAGYAGNRNAARIPTDKAKAILDELAGYGVKAVTFTGGGEPAMHKDLDACLAYAREIGLDVALITNGGLLTGNKALIEQIVASCTWCRVSLDAGTHAVFEKTHGVGIDAFSDTVDAILQLSNMKKYFKSKCTIGVGFLTSKETMGDMITATRIAKAAGADYIQFRPFVTNPQEIDAGQVEDYSHYDEILDNIDKCQEINGIKVLTSKHKYTAIKDSVVKRPYAVCHGHHFASVIGADLKMYLCCHLRGREEYEIGDLKVQSFKDAWESETRQSAYNNIDWADCPYLCRCDSFNRILWNISRKKEHVNFL